MLTPEYLKRITEPVEESAFNMDSFLLSKIVKSIEKLFGKFNDRTYVDDKNKISNELYNNMIVAIGTTLPIVQNESKKAFIDATAKISKENVEFEKKLVSFEHGKGNLEDVKLKDIEPVKQESTVQKLNITDKEKRIIQSSYSTADAEIQNLTRTTALTSQQTFINVCDNAYIKVQSGTDINKAIVDAIDEAAKKGITTVSYPTKEDKVETAIARAVRTGVTQAAAKVSFSRCAEMGINYVLVSQHVGARVTDKNDYTNHSWWQGKAYKLDYNKEELKEFQVTKKESNENKKFPILNKIKEFMISTRDLKYPDFVDTCGYGKIQGICGVNCRHSFTPFYPGTSINTYKGIEDVTNEKAYNDSKKQREMERAIKATKRRLNALNSADNDSDYANQRKAELKALLRKQGQKYDAFCKENNLSRANWRLKIAKTEGVNNE